MILIPLGIVLLWVPGIFLMVYLFFAYHSLVLDEKSTLESVSRGSILRP